MKNVVCAIAKNENSYINEWVNYYLALGFDHIYLYDNNDKITPYVGNFLDAVVQDKVTIIDKRDLHEQGLQWKVYQEFYNNYNKTFDWCLFCDIDEFLTGITNINDFLTQQKFINAEQIRIRWKVFGDDDIISRDISKPIFGAFKKEIKNNTLSVQGKAIIRGGLSNILIRSCHYAFRSFDGGKTRLELLSYLPSGKQSFHSTYEINDDYSKETVFINHYMTKSLAEFINQKFYRGDAVWENRDITLDYFWQINKQTKQKLEYIKNTLYNIDLVVPYVNSIDKNWIELFNTYSKTVKQTNQTTAENRFRSSDDFFRYFFRSIEKNMPWVHNVFLLVQSKSQIPLWLDTSKVKIILHEQFIPSAYLPTFNSGTIEMFLQNIPGLSEHFIYANDDFYLLKQTKPVDFFVNNKCCFNLITTKIDPALLNTADSAWWQMCQNNHDIIFNTNHAIPFKRLGHEFRPYLKSKAIECFNKYKSNILDSISQFRNKKNLTCYLFSLYLEKNNLRLNSTIKKESIAGKLPDDKIINIIDSATMLCINDNSAEYNIYSNKLIRYKFFKLFPNKSSFELFDSDTIAVETYIPAVQKKKEDRRADGRSDSYLYF